jgi:hypothetical protein
MECNTSPSSSRSAPVESDNADGTEIEGNVRRITHRFNGQPVLQRTYTGTTLTASTYLHRDHLGSIAASSDGSGGALQRPIR